MCCKQKPFLKHFFVLSFLGVVCLICLYLFVNCLLCFLLCLFVSKKELIKRKLPKDLNITRYFST